MQTSTAAFPKKFDLLTPIISNEQVAQDHYLLRCACPEIARGALPGQFIHVLISQAGVLQAASLLLRRPFTIFTVEGEQISMLYQIIGEGTEVLSHLKPGDPLRVLGPLGNTFHIPLDLHPAIIVGGGAGIASLMLLAIALRKSGVRTLGLVASMNRARLLSVAELKRIGVEMHIATDDGSVGHHGFVTEILTQILEQPHAHELSQPMIYACGPDGMLRAVTKIAQDYRIPTQLAMENRMGCAMGVCLGCVCKVRMPDGGFEYQRVCTEGPVFNAAEIVW
ncbi:MAG: dihydroorotate dehydrogenase electron transfer subunit [Candidatus Poribacteria bacterium]|nr:dihydroorotate dehydrogenase electron transfer subunit [Candidatus Poribacteria bacterium]